MMLLLGKHILSFVFICLKLRSSKKIILITDVLKGKRKIISINQPHKMAELSKNSISLLYHAHELTPNNIDSAETTKTLDNL